MRRAVLTMLALPCALILLAEPASAKTRHHNGSLFEQLFSQRAKNHAQRKTGKKRQRPAKSASPRAQQQQRDVKEQEPTAKQAAPKASPPTPESKNQPKSLVDSLSMLSGLAAAAVRDGAARSQASTADKASTAGGPPLPEQRPDLSDQAVGIAPEGDDTPVPEPRPETSPETSPGASDDTAKSRKPAGQADKAAEEAAIHPVDPYAGNRGGDPAATGKQASAAASDAEKSGEAACEARLESLGVSFHVEKSLSDPEGCALPFPLSVSKLGDVSISPPATVNCAMAETLARFTRSVIAPTVKSTYGVELKRLSSTSGYVCRPRNGTTKLSEHAFGNAVDIGVFELADGASIAVKETVEPKEQAFLSTIRKAACGPFKTVLGPGSNADHAFHLHFDLAPRNSGAAYCH